MADGLNAYLDGRPVLPDGVRLRRVVVSPSKPGGWAVSADGHAKPSFHTQPGSFWKRKFDEWSRKSGARQRKLQQEAGLEVLGFMSGGLRDPSDSPEACAVGPDECRGYGVTQSEGWKDPGSAEYKEELAQLLREERFSKYAGLPDSAFEKLVTL